jgi:SecD/SecF fusion protein
MKDISRTKVVIIALITLISLFLTIPTWRYYSHLRHEQKPVGVAPVAIGTEPAAADVEAHARWEAENTQLVAWRKNNVSYLKWEADTEALRSKAIPLGLDLLGGVDVTLTIDREKSIATEIESKVSALQRRLDDEKLSAKLQIVDNDQAFTIQLTDKKDAQTLANLLRDYKGVLNESPTADELAAGQPLKLTLNTTEMGKSLKENIEGAKKGISDRVDALGVTQPRISLQGEDRIRVQVPGEKNPDRLIANVIRPAQLEFRLVHPDSNSLVDPQTGKLRAGSQLPLGTVVVPGKLANFDKAQQKLVTREHQYVVYKKAEITGGDLQYASVTYNPAEVDPSKSIQVSLEFNKEGAKKFSTLTTENANQNRQMAILLDGVVRSAPTINEPITDGRAAIFGAFSNEEATELSQVLKAGSLKAPLKIESKRTVGATMGTQSILSGVKALFLGGALIGAFMMFYYGTAGIIAVITLVLNILMVLAIMALSKATLTLSGIGGLLLTIGMAVDGNVLIYERIREELRAGRPLRQAINLGYHRAFGVIFDSHVTMLMSALVLLQFTEGSVFGFALTMTFGLIANLYTSLTVTHTLCGIWHNLRGGLSLGKFSIFANPKYDFVGMRKFSFSISGAVTIIALVLVMMSGGLKYGVDFAGGFSAETQFNRPVAEADLRKALEKNGFAETSVQSVTNQTNYYVIDVPLQKLSELKPEARAAIPNVKELSDLSYTQSLVEKTLQQTFPGQYEIKLTTGFGSQSGQEFLNLAIVVVVLASLSILIYLWFRMELVFGVAAVVALLHDLFIVLLLCTLWHVQISLDVVAALMVLMGFSVNDTIVIFDRVRENARGSFGKDFGTICNDAMNMSLSRTLITSGTVFLAVLALYFIGGEGLRPFAKVYLLGTITGTYSSDFIAAPLVYVWNKRNGNSVLNHLQQKKRRVEGAKPVGRTGAQPIRATAR